MTSFEKLMSLFEKDYYGFPFMMLCEMTAIITCILFARKDKTTLFFLFYLIVDFSVLILYCYAILSAHVSNVRNLIFMSNTIISLVELLTYYHFFLNLIRDRMVVKIMKLLRTLFVSTIIIFAIPESSVLISHNDYSSSILTVIEFLLLLVPCFVYFYELFKIDPIINLSKRPSFWIVTGIFFYTLISIPYYLLIRFVSNNVYEYRHILDLVLYYAPFSISFIFLTKAFLCKKTLTT